MPSQASTKATTRIREVFYNYSFCKSFLDVTLQLQLRATAEEAPCELTVTPSGLAFFEKTVGSGPEAVKGQLVKAHHVGKLESGKIFDSSHNRGKPLTGVCCAFEACPYKRKLKLRKIY
ncbi:PREDICTED: peptidyl-prolyl cis-trans isomerase FKBP13, chloroplastic-like [Populus euphratica]|uniref:Rotamase n=1 Tax=Populus euphratica TaxID=75702 RepID=A0AAJ6U5L0_POPEU|nr:PREDICTED: peptidyl-prolyl cis-trans isomerase FKBP13, chloroplastic-like [Populus euphratica]